MEKMISSGKLNEVYNISCKKEMTNIDLVTTVLKNFSLDFDSSVEFVKDRAGHDLRYSICNKKIKSSDLYIETNFEDSLGSTIEWYRKNMVNLHE
jgi:dTDP-glucose 4,6-dehydratase